MKRAFQYSPYILVLIVTLGIYVFLAYEGGVVGLAIEHPGVAGEKVCVDNDEGPLAEYTSSSILMYGKVNRKGTFRVRERLDKCRPGKVGRRGGPDKPARTTERYCLGVKGKTKRITCPTRFCTADLKACAKKTPGMTCTTSDECDTNRCVLGLCVRASQAVGAQCFNDAECMSGFCFESSCQEKVQDGEVCTDDALCVSGLCNSGGTCGLLPDSQFCDRDDECVTGICNHDRPDRTCGVLPDNRFCSRPQECESNLCITHGSSLACGPVRVRHICEAHNWCDTGWCHLERCRATEPPGHACSLQEMCDSGRCIGNVCTDLLTPGFSCTLDSQCESGTCVNNRCAALRREECIIGINFRFTVPFGWELTRTFDSENNIMYSRMHPSYGLPDDVLTSDITIVSGPRSSAPEIDYPQPDRTLVDITERTISPIVLGGSEVLPTSFDIGDSNYMQTITAMPLTQVQGSNTAIVSMTTFPELHDLFLPYFTCVAQSVHQDCSVVQSTPSCEELILE